MKFLITIFPAMEADAQQLTKANEDSAAVLWQLYFGGVIREMYMRDDERGTVFVAEAPDATVIRDALSATPLVQSGLVTGDIVGLKPFAPVKFDMSNFS